MLCIFSWLPESFASTNAEALSPKLFQGEQSPEISKEAVRQPSFKISGRYFPDSFNSILLSSSIFPSQLGQRTKAVFSACSFVALSFHSRFLNFGGKKVEQWGHFQFHVCIVPVANSRIMGESFSMVGVELIISKKSGNVAPLAWINPTGSPSPSISSLQRSSSSMWHSANGSEHSWLADVHQASLSDVPATYFS